MTKYKNTKRPVVVLAALIGATVAWGCAHEVRDDRPTADGVVEGDSNDGRPDGTDMPAGIDLADDDRDTTDYPAEFDLPEGEDPIEEPIPCDTTDDCPESSVECVAPKCLEGIGPNDVVGTYCAYLFAPIGTPCTDGVCAFGSCELGTGEPCSDSDDCAGGQCIDGVCVGAE